MDELPKEYTVLFNGISATIRELQALSYRLAFLQQQAEEIFISKPELSTKTVDVIAG